MSQPLIRPNQIDILPFLPDDKKQYYKNGLAGLWQRYDKAQPGTAEKQELETKIRAASAKLMQDLAQARGQRPGSGGGPPPQQRPPTQSGMSGQQSGASQQSGTPHQNNGSQSAPGQQGNNSITPYIRGHLSGIQIHIPPTVATANHPQYKQKWYAAAVAELGKLEKAMAIGKKLQPQVLQMQSVGQQLPPAMSQQFEQAKKDVTEAQAKWNKMKTDNENQGQANRQVAQAQQRSGQGQAPQQVHGTSQAPPMQRQGSTNAQGEVKQEQKMSPSPPQAQQGFTQQQQQPQQPVNPNASMQNTQQPQQQPQQQQQQQPPQQPQQQPQPQQTPQGAPQPQMHPQQSYQQQPAQQQHPQQPYQNQNQQRPQIHQQYSQSQGQGQGQPQPHPQQAKNAAAPNNAGQQQQPQNQNQRPQALSQQAAMAQAAAQYAQGQSQQQVPQQGQAYPAQPQVPNALPFNNQPPSANQPTPTSGGFPQPQSLQPMQTNHNRFPIAKTINLSPATHQPVQGPASRPTLSNSGMIQQPGLARPAPFTLEGEGDRVLSKRKLDELVRQVTGGAEDGFLTPEVEELVLQYADDFVDGLITSACKLAKCKPNQNLEIKDFQIVLERNWGIRIPGYALDEVRTVRKFVPAQGWQSKMQAIQTAKTLGGVGKGDS